MSLFSRPTKKIVTASDKVLDLRGCGYTNSPEDIACILKLIAQHKGTLEEVYLANNDLRDGLSPILDALKTVSNLCVLDIVDNNLDASLYAAPWSKLAELTCFSGIEEL
jgi:hypothetical protein